jgi:hypothetical protein
MTHKWAWGLALLFVFSGVALGEDKKSDLLDEVAKRRQVAAQAFELEVREAIAQADKVKSTDPAKAIQLLKAALEKLEKDDLLTVGQRVNHRLNIKERLAILEDPKKRAEAEAAAKQAAEIDRMLAQLKADRELEASLRVELDKIKALQQAGQLAEAQRLAADLARRHPDSLAALQAQRITSTGDRVGESYRLSQEKAVASNKTIDDILRSSISPKDDITYPPREKWDALTKRRAKYLEVPMTEREKAIVTALDEEIKESVRFKGETFETVLSFLEKQIGHPILVDKASMNELGITYDRKLDVSLPRQITKRSLLRGVLAELGLTYVIKDERIQVMDVERAKQNLTVRMYPIDDLIGFPGIFGQRGPNGRSPIDDLIDLIQDQIDPLSWEKNNGPGSITYVPSQRVLLIKNTAEVINMIGGRKR